MKIIIVEDDALIAYQIQSCVENLGHNVLALFDNGVSALEFLSEHKVDFAFMDIELNGSMDGIQCAYLLKNDYNTPSVFVTSHDETDVIEEAISINPLNFLPKPFSDKNIEAVVALVEITLKKYKVSTNSSSEIEFAQYSFNFQYNTLKLKDEIIRLTPNESKLISLLFKNIGNTISIEEIKSHIWHDKEVSSAAFRKLISRINQNLLHIQIIPDRGLGYYLQNKHNHSNKLVK